MTRAEVDDMKNRLDNKCAACNGIPEKYKDAFRNGIQMAKFVLDRHAGKPKEWALADFHRLLDGNLQMPGNKKEAYRKALRSAMSMVHNLKA